MKFLCLLIGFVVCGIKCQPYSCVAQKKWSLADCVEYAIIHNLQIKKGENNYKESEIQLNTARNSRFPNLSSNISESIDFGRTVSENNTYINKNIQYTNFSISTSVPIFTGFQILNNIRLKEIHRQTAQSDLQIVKEIIRTDVTTAFFHLLYTKEILAFAEAQTSFVRDLQNSINRHYEIGLVAESEVYEARSRVAQCELQEVQAQNDVMLASLSLCQIMELDSTKINITYELTNDELFAYFPLPLEIYKENIENNPIIKSAKTNLHAAEKSLKIAVSEFLPKISFSAGISTQYYNYSSSPHQHSFWEQIEHNANTYIGLNISIPIFNRFFTRNNVLSSKLNISNQTIALEDAKKSILKEIQQAYYNVIASRKQFESSNTAKKAAEERFRFAEVKYRNGSSTSAEFNEIHTTYLKSCTEFLQSKYDYAYRCLVLYYYTDH